MIGVVTIAREYGSGGAELGRLVSVKMGWKLLDRQLVDRVAHVSGVDPKPAASLDEHTHHWWQWAIAGMSHASPYGYSTPAPACEMDEDFVHDITMRLIQRAAYAGNCVIVGRGAIICCKVKSKDVSDSRGQCSVSSCGTAASSVSCPAAPQLRSARPQCHLLLSVHAESSSVRMTRTTQTLSLA